MGADDYLVKPFSIRELLARVRAIFRRVEAFSSKRSDDKERLITVGDMSIDLSTSLVTIVDRAIDLTSKEFDLLTHFQNIPDGSTPGRNFWTPFGDMVMRVMSIPLIPISTDCTPRSKKTRQNLIMS